MSRCLRTDVFLRALRSSSSLTACVVIGSAVLSAGGGAASAGELPTGGTVVSGSASIGSAPNAVTIDQASDRAVIDWRGFSVGAGDAVRFNQPGAGSATLNRVTGAATSTIAGQITANGAVYLVNPNGIAITSTGSVQTGGGFVASTLDIANDDFMAGKLAFTGHGASARVSNAGRISAGSGAYVALLGGAVSNSGTISVPLGKVGLGSGESIVLDLNGDGFMQVALPTAAGDPTLIDVAGSIVAAGGRVELRAATVKDAVRNIVNLSGVINADSAVGDGGSIVLIGGADPAHMSGTVTVSGTLSARATGETGNGGFVETSGEHVDLNGASVATTAAHGHAGTWLIDPTDFTVAASGGDITGVQLGTNLNAGNVTILSSSGASGTTGNINVNAAVGWTSANTLTLNAANTIVIGATITAPTGGLTLTANNLTDTSYISDNSALSVGTFILSKGTWYQTGPLPAFSATDFGFDINNANFFRVSGGNGTAAQPYQISDVYGLQGMASTMLLTANALGTFNYSLANDIDASGTAKWNGGLGFVPIGTDGAGGLVGGNYGYGATFDGAGHSISNLTINRAAGDLGLFGAVGQLGIVQNVGLVGGNIKSTSAGTYTGVGALIGLNYGVVNNSYSSAAVSGTYQVGGLIGGNYGKVTNSYATGTVTNSGPFTGGLIGFSGGSYAFPGSDGSVTNVYATGAVSGVNTVGGLIGQTFSPLSRAYATGAVSGGGTNIGGLVGISNANITQVYASGAISGGGPNVGGLIGMRAAAGVTNSYFDSYSTGQAVTAGCGAMASCSGITAVTSDPAQSAAANYAFKASAYANLSAAAGIGTSNPTGYVFFDGQTRPFLAFEVPSSGGTIVNSHQLQLINTNATTLAASYTLANTIDLTETGQNNGTAATSAGMWAATGFVPLGTNGAGTILNGGAGYTGTFNGSGRTVNNIYIKRSASDLGLFGYIGVGGVVQNVGVVGGSTTSLTRAPGGNDGVGGLAGINYGTISNSFATVPVSGTYQVGGLIGGNYGPVSNSYATGNATNTGLFTGGLIGYNGTNGNLSNDYATGSVTSGKDNAGGLVGTSVGTLVQVYATGSVTSASSYVGGLLGSSSGSITQAYATGAVSGGVSGTYIGGLVGSNGGAIAQAYATGAVSGGAAGSYVGGLIGFQGATITNSYFDTYSTGRGTTAACGNTASCAGVTAITSDPAQSAAANYAFKTAAYANLAAAAGIGTAMPSGYVFFDGQTRPFLAFEVPVAGGSLVNSHQLQLIDYSATTLAASYTLANTIDLAETGRNTGTAATSAGMWAATGFIPLGINGTGTVLNSGNGYTGNFNGLGRTVNNIFVKRSVSDLGLFGKAGTGAIIQNVGVVGGSVTSLARAPTSFDGVGGLVGINRGTISNTYSTAAVSGAYQVGGLVGGNYGPISNSYATGAVTSSGKYSGGLVAYSGNSSALTNVYATGAVSGTTKVGGLFGEVVSGVVTRAYATGSVTGSDTVGGLIGYLDGAGKLNQTYATGTVSGTTKVGGLVGFEGNPNAITNSYFDTYSTGQAATAGCGNTASCVGVTAVTSDPGQSGSANYAFKTSAYAGFTPASGIGTASPSGWVFFDGQTRPFLAFEVPAAGSAVVGSHQLQLIDTNAATLAASYTLGKSIDLAETGRNTGTAATSAGMWAATGFVPLGITAAGGIALSPANAPIGFSGSLDGGGYTLSNLTIRRPSASYVGLFGFVTGSVANLGLTGVSVQGKSSVGGLAGQLFLGARVSGVSEAGAVAGAFGAVTSSVGYVGGLVGTAQGATITGSTSAGTVDGTSFVGGLVGYELGTIKNGVRYTASISNSTSSAVVTGHQATISGTGQQYNNDFIGGLVGYQRNDTVNTNVSASGAVNGMFNIGGLAGVVDGNSSSFDTNKSAQLSNASASGAVNGGATVGGLVGQVYTNAVVSLAYATGNVSATGAYAGGLVGIVSGGSLNQTYATGTVGGSLDVGGLAGVLFSTGSGSAAIGNSYATGGVTGTSNVGGLVGLSQGVANSVVNSYETGVVNTNVAGTTIGGLIGAQGGTPATVTSSYWNNTVNSALTSAGGTGVSSAQLMMQSTFVGWDFTGIWLLPDATHPPRLRFHPTL